MRQDKERQWAREKKGIENWELEEIWLNYKWNGQKGKKREKYNL